MIANGEGMRERRRDRENRLRNFCAAISALRDDILGEKDADLVKAQERSLTKLREECAKVEGDLFCCDAAKFVAIRREYCNLTPADIECCDRTQQPPKPTDKFGNYCPTGTLV